MRHRRRAFTLVELLVVVGIITMLLAILLPVINKTMAQSRLTKCLSNQHQVYVGLRIFTQNNGDLYPGGCGIVGTGPGTTPYIGVGQLVTLTDALPQTVLEQTSRSAMLVRGYMKDSSVFRCPQQDAQQQFELSILIQNGVTVQANFHYVFNQLFIGDLQCNPADLLPLYSSAYPQLMPQPNTTQHTYNRDGRCVNPTGCVLITEDGLNSDTTQELKTVPTTPPTTTTTTYIHASPIHGIRGHKDSDTLHTYTQADKAVCTYVDGHTEAVNVDPTTYGIASDHTGLLH